jgi:hypothetical protein
MITQVPIAAVCWLLESLGPVLGHPKAQSTTDDDVHADAPFPFTDQPPRHPALRATDQVGKDTGVEQEAGAQDHRPT